MWLLETDESRREHRVEPEPQAEPLQHGPKLGLLTRSPGADHLCIIKTDHRHGIFVAPRGRPIAVGAWSLLGEQTCGSLVSVRRATTTQVRIRPDESVYLIGSRIPNLAIFGSATGKQYRFLLDGGASVPPQFPPEWLKVD